MSAETGFRDVPWQYLGGADDTNMPPDPGEAGPACREQWHAWTCTRPGGHDGTCRAGTGRYILAEWYRDAEGDQP